MAVFLNLRCANHPSREAVARCPECGRNICRECVTDHEGRAVCSSCLARLTRPAEERSRSRALEWTRRLAAAALGLCLAWVWFTLLGMIVQKIPASVHEGTVWESR